MYDKKELIKELEETPSVEELGLTEDIIKLFYEYALDHSKQKDIYTITKQVAILSYKYGLKNWDKLTFFNINKEIEDINFDEYNDFNFDEFYKEIDFIEGQLDIDEFTS